jgi:hypothetical protein
MRTGVRPDFDAASEPRSKILRGHDGQTFPAFTVTSDCEDTSAEAVFLQQGKCKLPGIDVRVVKGKQNWLIRKRVTVFIPS